MAKGRVTNLGCGRTIERRKYAPQEDVAGEVERLDQGIVGRRLSCGDEPEWGAGREETVDHVAARRHVLLAQGRIAGEARVVGEQKEGPELLVELKRGIFDGPRRERRTRPPSIDGFRDFEAPADELLDKRGDPRVARADREKRTAHAVRIPRPHERQDLVIREDGNAVAVPP